MIIATPCSFGEVFAVSKKSELGHSGSQLPCCCYSCMSNPWIFFTNKNALEEETEFLHLK